MRSIGKGYRHADMDNHTAPGPAAASGRLLEADAVQHLLHLDLVHANGADGYQLAFEAAARHAKNADNAVKFLEYLVSPSAQNHFANGNNEWPAAKGVNFDNPALKAMTGGSFKSELLPISAVGMNQIKVQQMLDRVGFK